MNTDKLIKTIPTLQSQVDSLLEFDCTANDLTNGVINAAFMLLFRDLIRLFACYNDGIINCLGTDSLLTLKYNIEINLFVILFPKNREILRYEQKAGARSTRHI